MLQGCTAWVLDSVNCAPMNAPHASPADSAAKSSAKSPGNSPAAPPDVSPGAGISLVDIGLNLGHDSFDEDRAAVVARAQAAGVTRMVITGASLPGTERALEVVRQWPETMRCTAGIHPHHATDLFEPGAEERLRALIQQPEIVAGGECGLDFFRNFSPQPIQIAAFEKQLEVCAEYQLPVFLHQRDAHPDFIKVLDRWLPQLPRAVVHCFTGTGDELQDYLDRDLYVGITGWICDERRGHHLRELVGRIPLHRLMLETDAPYLLPRDLPKTRLRHSGDRRNEPAYLPHILATVAHYRGESPETTAAGTTAAAQNFFGWP